MNDRRPDDPETQTTLAEWVARLAAELDVETVAIDSEAVLSLAGTVAHRVVRPAAPLTTYLVGVGVGRAIARGEDPAAALREIIATVRRATEHSPPAS